MTNRSAYLTQTHPPQEGTTWKTVLAYGMGITLVGGAGAFLIGRYLKDQKERQSDNKSLIPGSPQTIAKQLKMAFENNYVPGTDLVKLRELFQNLKSIEQFDEVVKEYHKQFDSNLLADMKGELSTSEYEEMLYIKAAKPQKEGQTVPLLHKQRAWAYRLKAAFDKTYGFIPSVDKAAIEAVFEEIPTQTVFMGMAKMYQIQFKRPLVTDLRSKLGLDYNIYMLRIAKKPKT